MSANTLSTTPEFSSAGTFSSSYSSPPPVGNTDLIHQEIKVYIEGVQVPFINISISQAIGQMPTCELQIPPKDGLMEIVRYYEPKIHIFYTDNVYGGDRLLFWGHICAAAYNKSRQGPGNAAIRFRCRHRLKLLDDILLYFGNPVDANNNMNDIKPEEASLLMDSLNSSTAITRALMGITGPRTEDKDNLIPSNPKLLEADITKLQDNIAQFEQRLIGIPGSIVNLWNQIKRFSCYNPNMHFAMLAMHIPLFEEAIGFFKRLSGHYPLEKIQQDSKSDYCPDGKVAQKILVPPAFRGGSQSAAQGVFAVEAIQNGVGFSGEMTSFLQLCEQFLDRIMYEMVVLASPSEVDVDPTKAAGQEVMAVETIIKPTMPFYYSPICNVIYPRMFESIDIDQDEMSIPTRIEALSPDLLSSGSPQVHYRAPNSVREAMSLARYYNMDSTKASEQDKRVYSLSNTTSANFGIPGKYEQGRGIRMLRVNMPNWLVLLVKNYIAQGTQTDKEGWPEIGTSEYTDLLMHMKDWEQRYGIRRTPDQPEAKAAPEKYGLDPYSPKAVVNPHERLMFASVDYEFSKCVARARSGTISCVFNPYIVPGYPMDVIDDSPNHPSFHGMCSAVTHTITARSIGTTVSMVAAISYSELSNYYTPGLHPWLETTLGMINETSSSTDGAQTTNSSENSSSTAEYGDTSKLGSVNSTLLQNPKAKEKADDFYRSVLGVGAADPSDLFDYATGQAMAQVRIGDLVQSSSGGVTSIKDTNGGEMNEWLTTQGNLQLVARSIESRDAIADKFDYTFIDMLPEVYCDPTIGYSNPMLMSGSPMEPGQSMFLDYKETEDFIVPAAPSTT